MATDNPIAIDTAEEFPHLSRAPIIEAVVDIRAFAEIPWDEKEIRKGLTERLPDYPSFQSHREFRQEFQLGSSPESPAKHSLTDLGWKGFLLRSEDQLHVVQHNRDGFVFSRLTPYPHWGQFVGEALRLWRIHVEVARPSEAHRIGLRFINGIACPFDRFELDDYLRVSPQPPAGLDLPYTGFFYQDTLDVVGHPYGINIVKTIQPPQGAEGKAALLIIDIDVFTTERSRVTIVDLERHLARMRWLKNKVFFGTITDREMESLR